MVQVKAKAAQEKAAPAPHTYPWDSGPAHPRQAVLLTQEALSLVLAWAVVLAAAADPCG